MAKIYKIKHLIKGYKISPKFKNKILVCCPENRGYTHIAYNKQLIETKDPVCHLTFKDKFGRGSYTLTYFELPTQKGINTDIELFSNGQACAISNTKANEEQLAATRTTPAGSFSLAS